MYSSIIHLLRIAIKYKMKKIKLDLFVLNALLCISFSYSSCSKFENSREMKYVDQDAKNEPEQSMPKKEEEEKSYGFFDFIRNPFAWTCCQPKEEEIEIEFDGRELKNRDSTVEQMNGSYVVESNMKIEEAYNNSIEKSKKISNVRRLANSTCASSIFDNSNGNVREKNKVYVIRRNPFDRNPYNSKVQFQKSTEVIKIFKYDLDIFEDSVLESCRDIIKEIQKNKSNHKEKKRKFFDTEESYENSVDNIKSRKTEIEPNENEVFSTIDIANKIISSIKSNSFYILDKDISKDSIDYHCNLQYPLKKEEEFYPLLYSKVLPSRLEPISRLTYIEYPYSLPTVREVLLIFFNSFKTNFQDFYDKRILTNTIVNPGYLTVMFNSKACQFIFEYVDSRDENQMLDKDFIGVKKLISNGIVYRVAVQRLECDTIIKKYALCYDLEIPLFCCYNKLVNPKYLCHCCYCPSFSFGRNNLELCNCGLSNWFWCYMPAISGCCMTEIRLSDYADDEELQD